MNEAGREHVEQADHETLSDAQMVAFWKAYEAALRHSERPARDRSAEATWGAKRKRFLEAVAHELGV